MSAALDEIRPNSLDARDVDYYRLLSADVALHEGRIDDANEIVASLSARAPETLGAEYGPLIARLCTARGDHVCAANAWLTTSVGNADRQTVNDRAWEAMGRTSRTEATRLAQSGDTRAAWQLREAIGTAFSLDEQRQRFRNWSSNWPGHAFTALPPTPLARALSTTWRPTTIAVFAPLSGNLAAAGHAVRDGMMAALLADSSQEKPRLVFYDSAAEPIALLYDRAAGAGASVIVGPVEKASLEELASLNPTIPVVGLNLIDAAVPGVLQVGLAIEDEARTVADRLLASQYQSLLVLHNGQDWSRRATGVLLDTWPHPVEVAELTEVKTIPQTVGRAMLIEKSVARRDELATLLGEELQFVPRARADLDAVVAFVSQAEAAALVPALKFHFADQLPVFASSQSIRATAGKLGAFDGFSVTEMPFTLHPDAMSRELIDAFRLGESRFASLYALGIDGYRIANQAVLFTGDEAPGPALCGSTGTLIADRDGRFARRLDWGKVEKGRLVPTAASAL
jgi:outer membrane PBP1 activator LpoA protein